MEKYIKKYWAITLALMIFAFVMIASPAQAAEYWKIKYTRFSATAGETLAVGDVVCIHHAHSTAFKADADDANKRPAVGVIGKGGSSGSSVEIVVQGILAGQTAVSAGDRLFLSTTAGVFTTTEPTNAQTLGWVLPGSTTEIAASESTNYYVNVVPPVSDGAAY